MKIATFNINGINSRLPALLKWLAKSQPDVACLQELKAPDNRFPAQALRDAGYHAIWHGQTSWNGVAILSKEPAVESRRGLPGDAKDVQSRYLEAAIGGVLVGCLYLPNGNPQPGPKFDYKLAWFDRFNKYAKALLASKHPVVLAGDYNVVPTDFDIYNPKSWLKDALLQPESRAAYARLLAQGWTDSLRTLHPDKQVFTFWDYFRNHWQRNAGLRIDHLLLSEALAPKLRRAEVDAWVRGEPKASDHAPVWIELDVDGNVEGDGQARKARKASKASPAKPSPAGAAGAKRKASAAAAPRQSAVRKSTPRMKSSQTKTSARAKRSR